MALIRHSMLAAASAIVLTGSRFGFMAILSRRLAVVDFGRVAYTQWLVDLSILLCSFGVNALASRYFAEYRTRPALLAAVMRRWRQAAFGAPLLAAIATVVAGAWVTPEHTLLEFGATAAWSFANGAWAMQMAALTGLQRFDRILWANGVSATVLLLGAALLPDAAGVAGVFALCAAANLAAAAFSWHATQPFKANPDATDDAPPWRSIGHYALNMWLTALLWSLVWSRGEWPFVKADVGDAGIAHYAAVTTLFGGAVQGIMLAVAGLAPQLTLLVGRGQAAEALALSRKAMDMQLLIAGGLAVGLALFAPWLLGLAFGANYRAGAEALACIALGLPALAWACHNHLLQLATDARFTRDATLAGLVLLFALAAVLVPRFGIEGAAASRAATMGFMSVLSLAMTVRRWGGDAMPWRNLAVAAASVACAIAAALLRPELPLGARIALFALLALVLVFGVREGGRACALVWGRMLLAPRTQAATQKSEQCA